MRQSSDQPTNPGPPAEAGRYLALWLPRLSTDRIWPGSGGRPDERPLACFARDGGALRLTAVNRAAARLGLSPSLALADARARLPGLAVAEADPLADARFLENLADWCQRFTPLVALAPPDAVVLDVTGAAHLFGGEAGLARALETAFRRRGLALRAAIAGVAALALALARFGTQTETVRILPPAGTAMAAGLLPAAALGLDGDGSRLLRRLGLDTVGSVEAQPRETLLARLGRPALDALDHLHGRQKPPFVSRHAPPACLAERAFAEPVASQEVALSTLARLMEDVSALLERRGEGARRVAAVFFRADGAVRRLEIATAGAVRDPAMIERLFRERLASLADPLDPGFGFDLIRLEATETAPFDEDERGMPDLDAGARTRANMAAAFSELVDALGARLGPERVRLPLAVDSHVPERAAILAPARAALAIAAPEAHPASFRLPGAPPSRPLRLFDPPEPIEALAEVPDGPPARFRWRRAMHQVARAEGPERIAPEWWIGDDPAATRDYFRVEDAAGRRFWLYREGMYGHQDFAPRWFMHGLFA